MFVLLLALSGCRTAPRVVPIDFEILDLGSHGADGLADDLARGRLVEIQVDGRTQSIDDLHSWPPEVATAAYALLTRPRATEHIDLLLPLSDVEERPVTLQLRQRVLSVQWTEPRPKDFDTDSASELAKEAVVRRFGIGALRDGDAPWRAWEVRVVDDALASLEPGVLDLLRGMPFVRSTASPRAANKELAWFDPRTEPPTIEVYDLAFAPAVGAVGPHPELHPLATMTLVHEVGHVVADAPLRKRWLLAVSGETPAVPMSRTGPVIDGWKDVREHRAPTPYGRRDVHESFAEAYALHRLDPDALAEVMPEGAAWFARQEHLRLAQLDPEPP